MIPKSVKRFSDKIMRNIWDTSTALILLLTRQRTDGVQ
jgi:hypothetical protein